jgi:hypothetical protein
MDDSRHGRWVGRHGEPKIDVLPNRDELGPAVPLGGSGLVDRAVVEPVAGHVRPRRRGRRRERLEAVHSPGRPDEVRGESREEPHVRPDVVADPARLHVRRHRRLLVRVARPEDVAGISARRVELQAPAHPVLHDAFSRADALRGPTDERRYGGDGELKAAEAVDGGSERATILRRFIESPWVASR